MDTLIDYDRGVIKKRHQASGVDVYMYRNQPGYYLNAYGVEVTPEMAELAGFDTARYGKMRRRDEMLAKAHAEIEDDLAAADHKPQRKVVQERNGFSIVDIGLGRHMVEGPDGLQLTTVPMPKEQAELLFSKLVPVTTKQEPAPKADPNPKGKTEMVRKSTEGDYQPEEVALDTPKVMDGSDGGYVRDEIEEEVAAENKDGAVSSVSDPRKQVDNERDATKNEEENLDRASWKADMAQKEADHKAEAKEAAADKKASKASKR